MPQLQPYVSNVPLQVAKNLRFQDDNGIPVTEMLPVGMNGTVVNDTPKTGYISRIGAVVSDQIDLYNQVVATLNTYGQNISTLQQQVAALELSGTTIPIVNGHCFTGNANSPITTVVDLMATSVCDYNTVLGTTSALMQAILAEGASTLNVLSAFSQASAMAGLSGWISVPATIADSVNNIWLAYRDSRTGIANAISQLTPSCSQAVINFFTRFSPGSGTTAGIGIYFSGYSFIPTAYTDNGSTISITDGVGGIYNTGVDIVARSQPGADRLFVGISGTSLAPATSYTVTLNSKIKSSYNTCTTTVIHTTTETSCGDCSDSNISGSTFPHRTGTATIGTVSNNPTKIINGLPFIPSYADIQATDTASADILRQYSHIFTFDGLGSVYITFSGASGSNLNFRWIAYR